MSRRPFLRHLQHAPFHHRDVLPAPWRKRTPRSPPVARGIPARSKNSLPLFPKKVAPPIVPPKRPSSPDRIPPLLVVNGMIGIGEIGNLNFRAQSDRALLSVFIIGNRPLDLFIDLRDTQILLNV